MRALRGREPLPPTQVGLVLASWIARRWYDGPCVLEPRLLPSQRGLNSSWLSGNDKSRPQGFAAPLCRAAAFSFTSWSETRRRSSAWHRASGRVGAQQARPLRRLTDTARVALPSRKVAPHHGDASSAMSTPESAIVCPAPSYVARCHQTQSCDFPFRERLGSLSTSASRHGRAGQRKRIGTTFDPV